MQFITREISGFRLATSLTVSVKIVLAFGFVILFGSASNGQGLYESLKGVEDQSKTLYKIATDFLELLNSGKSASAFSHMNFYHPDFAAPPEQQKAQVARERDRFIQFVKNSRVLSTPGKWEMRSVSLDPGERLAGQVTIKATVDKVGEYVLVLHISTYPDQYRIDSLTVGKQFP